MKEKLGEGNAYDIEAAFDNLRTVQVFLFC